MLLQCSKVVLIVYVRRIIMMLMGKRLGEVRERLRNMSEEEKAELARLAGEAYGKRRARQST